MTPVGVPPLRPAGPVPTERGPLRLGPEVDSAPALPPGGATLVGRVCRLERLRPEAHGASLWQALRADDAVWTYMSYGPFADRSAFDAWLGRHAQSSDPLAYAVVDGAERAAIGIATLMAIRPEARVIEVGSLLFSPRLQGTTASTEAQYLLARHVFEDLRYRRYEWKCNSLNAASRRAAERLGFTFEGIFRQHMIVKGRNRDTAWYAMLDRAWPRRRAAFERWLAPGNFREDGTQIAALSAFDREEAD